MPVATRLRELRAAHAASARPATAAGSSCDAPPVQPPRPLFDFLWAIDWDISWIGHLPALLHAFDGDSADLLTTDPATQHLDNRSGYHAHGLRNYLRDDQVWKALLAPAREARAAKPRQPRAAGRSAGAPGAPKADDVPGQPSLAVDRLNAQLSSTWSRRPGAAIPSLGGPLVRPLWLFGETRGTKVRAARPEAPQPARGRVNAKLCSPGGGASRVHITRPPTKSHARMLNKLESAEDHRDKPPPRPKANVDTTRAGVVVHDARLMPAVYDAIAARVGAFVRVKNAFAEGAQVNYGYRAILGNLRLESGLTVRDVFGGANRDKWVALGRARRLITPRPYGEASLMVSVLCQTAVRSHAKMGSRSLMVASS